MSTSIDPQRSPIHLGSQLPSERTHPHFPRPHPVTGELIADPEIELKAKQFNLAVSFFYSSMYTDVTMYGLGRSASVNLFLESDNAQLYVTLTRGDLAAFYFSRAGSSGNVATYTSSKNANLTTLTYNFVTKEFTE